MSVHNLNLVLTVMTQGSFKFSNSIYHEHLKTQLSHHFSLPTAEKPLFLQHAIMLLQRRNLLILPCDYKKKFEHWNPIAESCFMAVFMMILNKLMFFLLGEGNGNPLQCSCLENPRDRGAWWAAVYGVTQNWTQLKWLSSSSSIFF